MNSIALSAFRDLVETATRQTGLPVKDFSFFHAGDVEPSPGIIIWAQVNKVQITRDVRLPSRRAFVVRNVDIAMAGALLL